MKRYSVFLFLMLPFFCIAQPTLSLHTAIDTALKNNFDIQIARNYSEINRINNSFGVAGGLPSINISAGDNASYYNQDQKLSTGLETHDKNISSNAFNANISASMVLFNGFKIMATKERLNFLQKQSELELNLQIQNTMAAIMLTYFDIIRQQSYLRIIQSSLDVSAQKLEIIKQRKNVGMANDADVLQAQIDMSLTEQNFNEQQIIIEQQKTNLLQLMGTKEFYLFSVQDTIMIDQTLRKEEILNYLNNNPQYLSAEQQIKINEQIVKETSAQRFPSIRINTGYNFTNNNYSSGTYLMNQTYGPTVGATLQIPIFNGFIYKTQQDVAQFNVKNAILQKESILTSLKASVEKTYQSYQNTLQQLASQQINYDNTRKLVEIILQRFQLNQATILDIKAAQSSFEDAGYMLVNFQYSAKAAEIELKRLIYRLQ